MPVPLVPIVANLLIGTVLGALADAGQKKLRKKLKEREEKKAEYEAMKEAYSEYAEWKSNKINTCHEEAIDMDINSRM